jgi:Icc-related predicted phosphoesterase
VASTRVYFISDVHGSNRCFKKFLNAAKFYQADVLILGGDITGKFMIPVVEQDNGTFKCTYQGSELVIQNRQEAEAFIAKAADSGAYALLTSQSEFKELDSSPEKVTALFERLMVERVKEWVALAEERLGKTSVRCYISPGNDDIFGIDDALSSSNYVINPEGRVVKFDDQHEMITLGYTNHTPWNSAREVDESVLAGMISGMADKVENMESAVFNIHVPPIDTPLDKAPQVDKNLKIVVKTGSVQMISAGSTACRDAIKKYQPLLGLHGHIHESRGIVKLGRTLCANPGSEYGEGILRGFVANLEGDKVKSYLLTSG